mgnify:CR=1 FL=1
MITYEITLCAYTTRLDLMLSAYTTRLDKISGFGTETITHVKTKKMYLVK